jgi:hypothetical protein
MPRVNRDLQRRMAARRERRRAPTERRYQFGPSAQPDAVGDELLDQTELDDETAAAAVPTATLTRPTRRGDVPAAAHRPFSSYAAEYAYVGQDLRRVSIVVGILLAALIVLYFILPH